jgi:hypothetical protein
MKTKKTYRITAIFPIHNNTQPFTFEITAYGISWIPWEAEKAMRISHPDTYLFAEITKIEIL